LPPVELRRQTSNARARRLARIFWRSYLYFRGRLVPFLEPYWKTEEIEVGRDWLSGKAKNIETGVDDFEELFLKATGVDGLPVATSSGRTALSVALRALKKENPDRDQVIIPSYSCGGLLTPIVQNGLVPVYADVGYDLNLTEATVSPLISSRTLAIVVVHLGGKHANEVEGIGNRANGAVVIEDICQALGGSTASKPWGSSAQMAIYSFGLGKNLMATSGGMLIARTATDNVLKEKENLTWENGASPCARFSYMLGAHLHRRGILLDSTPPSNAFQSSYGFNKISLLDAQIMTHQLRRINEIISRRQNNAHIILDALPSSSIMMVPGKEGPNVWTKFIAVASTTEIARKIRKTLHRGGIDTETMYIPLHLRAEEYSGPPIPVTEDVYTRAFNIPVRPSIGRDQIGYIARIVHGAALEIRGME